MRSQGKHLPVVKTKRRELVISWARALAHRISSHWICL
jgi:hypothetical protein